MPVATGMKRAGYYDQHSTAQHASIQPVLDWIDRAIADMALPPAAQPFTALDLGSSEGRNALIVMDRVAESVRRRQPEQLVQTIYSDLPSNNFNRLFANLHEARTAGRIVIASATSSPPRCSRAVEDRHRAAPCVPNPAGSRIEP